MTNPLDYPRFPFRAGASAMTTAPLSAVWEQCVSIGGPNRYYYMNPLWSLRESLDALLGGRGLSRGRPLHTDLRPGDVIDSWRVLVVEPRERLALGFGMKAPGTGVLEFTVRPHEQQTRVRVTAYWSPRGVPGRMYWYAMEPAHAILFKGLARAICRRAETRASG
ncbi:MAG: DUF2867 domain-containing protein [Halorhodospira halophila]|uniref:DUF2867 domain-containing protein n=1 Tax=Halorhodospira TaxID=85108 RepID=UPI0019128352|nr:MULTISPECIES: DUF2867 domain-containing protein [Halorhodospira]MCC3749770.1 DUF2867 domain-containing protein [Halorhodospira halophila]MCG5527686.1 DUF2867 domain-containing protein [Halorhodospira halophila]MCG5534039.1 DUF2867 domain-containing protein [Halorhodospira sp. 9621]MCG5537729.1 DUF2867 domain-containing protein [Halorhodospira sp. 9622]MCG5539922.1 DUF2867 domain-containing protein [Halorhodospira sp. M39old]